MIWLNVHCNHQKENGHHGNYHRDHLGQHELFTHRKRCITIHKNHHYPHDHDHDPHLAHGGAWGLEPQEAGRQRRGGEESRTTAVRIPTNKRPDQININDKVIIINYHETSMISMSILSLITRIPTNKRPDEIDINDKDHHDKVIIVNYHENSMTSMSILSKITRIPTNSNPRSDLDHDYDCSNDEYGNIWNVIRGIMLSAVMVKQ